MSSVHETASSIAETYGGVNMARLNRAHLVEYMARHSRAISRETNEQLLAIYKRLVVAKLEAGAQPYKCEECGVQLAGIPDDEKCPVCASPTGDVHDEFDDPSVEIDIDSLSEKDLDESLNQVKQASVTTAVGYWRIGKELLLIFRSKLYRKRLDPETKKPKYKHWKHFVEAELPFSDRHARRAMAIAVAHTQETIADVGSIKKLDVVARITDPDQRARVIEKVRSEGTSIRALEGEVRKILEESGESREKLVQEEPRGSRSRHAEGRAAGLTNNGTRRIPPGERAPAARRAEPAPDPVPEPDRITAVVEPGEVVLEMRKRRDGKLHASEDNLNGIVTDYEVYREGDKTLIRITRRRP